MNSNSYIGREIKRYIHISYIFVYIYVYTHTHTKTVLKVLKKYEVLKKVGIYFILEISKKHMTRMKSDSVPFNTN